MLCIWIYVFLISHFSVIYIIYLRAENDIKKYPLSLIVSSHPAPIRTHVFLRQADHLMVEYNSLYKWSMSYTFTHFLFSTFCNDIIGQILPSPDTFSCLRTLLIPYIDFFSGQILSNSLLPDNSENFIINSEQGTLES